MSHAINIKRIAAVNEALQPLKQDFVFVGGAVLSLYADRTAEEVRETEDVDVVVEIYTRKAYSEMEEELRALGFELDTTSKFIGRFLKDKMIIDFMPLDEKVLGFHNRWYLDGFKQAMTITLEEMAPFKIFPAPYFVAAKLEAFKDRGRTERGELDGRISTDFEDFVFIIVNRQTIWEEMAQANVAVKTYLQNEFAELLVNPYFEEWIDAHTGYTSPAAQRIVFPQAKKFIQS